MPAVSRSVEGDPTLGELLTLRDDDAKSMVAMYPERGALVTSFSVSGTELLYLDEATLRDPNQNVRGGVPVLFPSPGKLEGDAWRRAGQGGQMKQHGFARNLAWTIRETASTPSASATLSLESNAATLAQYPWAFRAELTFTLAGTCLRIASRIRNDSGTSMPFALGYHPYFKVADKTQLRIDSQATRAFDNVRKRDVPFHGFDLTLDEVDVHLLDHPSTESALRFADGSLIRVSASPDFVRWVVWTRAGKDFVCLEPWTAPGNALNSGEHLVELPPAAEHVSWVEIALERSST